MNETTTITREQFLNKAVDALRPWFKQAGFPVPDKVRVTCGWPSSNALARKKRHIGECWPRSASKDKFNEIFISPCVDEFVAGQRAQCVGEILVHELVHAVDDCKNAHKGPFKKVMKAVGLEGKPTATEPGDALYAELKRIESRLCGYPHAKLDATKTKRKAQTTRMVKCECGDCGYTVRTTRKWLEDVGAPICPCNKKPMEFEIPEELEAD